MAEWNETQKLLLRWELRRLAYYEQLKKAEDPAVANTIVAMDFQLGKCIQELSEITDNEEHILTRRLMIGIENAQKEQQ